MRFQKLLNFKGSVKAPPSKSLMVRAIAAGVLSNEKLIINDYLACGDSVASVSVGEKLGKKIILKGSSLLMKGVMNITGDIELNCKESALTLRLFTPIVSLMSGNVNIIGERSLNSRPVDMMKIPLKMLGVDFVSANGKLPVWVKGPMRSGKSDLTGSVTSQFLSGLLMTLPLLSGDSIINVKGLRSVPYVDMTIELLKRFNIEVEKKGYSEFKIKGKQKYSGIAYTVEGDWSGSSFLLVMGALTGEIVVRGLNPDSLQGDRNIVSVLKKTGANLIFNEDQVTIKKNVLKPFKFDATECPDLFPPLTALAAGCEGISAIKGLNRLKYKESDRGRVLQKEFGILGVEIKLDKDVMLIKGGQVKGGRVSSHADHRISMSLITASTIASGIVEVDDVSCINKSYPGFLDDYNSLFMNRP